MDNEVKKLIEKPILDGQIYIWKGSGHRRGTQYNMEYT